MTTRTKGKQPKSLTEGDLGHLIGTLESQKQLGGTAYPPTLARLLDLANMPESLASEIARTQTAGKPLATTAKSNATKEQAKSALVMLRQDADAIASSPTLLLHCLRQASAADSELFTLTELADTLPSAVEKPFKLVWKTSVERNNLPPEIGMLRRRRYPMLFLLDRIPALARRSLPEASTDPAPSITERVLAAFDQLDRRTGGSNYVTLASLRAALPDLQRESLDDAIHQLRRERLVSLDSADGRHDRLSAEESAAGIVEEGSRLVYMARRK